jgi:metal-dependent amidase/aminoacylase/carboxypeptidase family protein
VTHDEMFGTLAATLQELDQQLVVFRRDLHAHPELSHG